ncbi:MAG: hypothetical protein ACKO3L_02010, partial [Actinomycetota bacterium]
MQHHDEGAARGECVAVQVEQCKDIFGVVADRHHVASRFEETTCRAYVVTRVGQQHHLGEHRVDFVHGVVRHRTHFVAAATQLVGCVGSHQAGAG